ncbi:hypothetical protein [Atribacter laminatus]|jgi:hypothetical protein|uniref:Uncharacterized protein n=1 Tax=Atribacter laminatus TaxID=2847778 RepID=A0A7T1F3Z4_ATRLM|nr:hypothetical protein [Atribacter laminatus]QPM68905.1 hypothetical protein RT761_02132 [Atribacter laminatus]
MRMKVLDEILVSCSKRITLKNGLVFLGKKEGRKQEWGCNIYYLLPTTHSSLYLQDIKNKLK